MYFDSNLDELKLSPHFFISLDYNKFVSKILFQCQLLGFELTNY